MEDVVIVSARAHAGGFLQWRIRQLPAHKLGQVAIQAALERAKVDGGEVSEVILGQVLTAAQGQNPARQASIAAGLPIGTAGLGYQHGVRLGPAHRGAGRPGYPQW